MLLIIIMNIMMILMRPIKLLMWKLYFVLILLFVFKASAGLEAHPHVFIDTTVTIMFDDEGITGFQIQWLFDEMFSSMIINDFDEDYNLQFNSTEIVNIEKNAFSNLKNFHYFSYISLNEKDFPFKKVTNFSASIIGERLIYKFFIPYKIKAKEAEQIVTVAVYDDSYYCDVAFAEKSPLILKNAATYTVRYEIVQNKKNPIYFGQVFPFEIVFYFRRKN